jgi:gag-polypeptide of LTR copia-type
LAQVLHAETSLQLWQHLKQFHTSQFLAKVLELKLLLQTSKKGNLTCTQFIQHMQGLADRLRNVGSMITDQDLVIYILQGLDSEYDAFVTAFSMRQDSPSMSELHSLLLAHEARIQINLKSLSSTSAHLLSSTQPVTDPSGIHHSEVMYTSGHPFRGPNSNQFTKNQPGHYARGRGRGYNRSRGRGRQQFQSNDTSSCQICLRWGHFAAHCYHHFDIRYSCNGSSGNSSSDISSSSQSNSNQHQALVAEPPNSTSNALAAIWFLDSGATTHVTSDINNLTYSQHYTDNDTVHIGNGADLSILHTGSATLPTKYHALQLSNVLHVSLITKNLLSVSQLTSDNNVFVILTF